MPPGVSRARRVGVVLACTISALAGIVLVFRLIDPTLVQRLHTIELLGLLGLLVLPLTTALAFRAWRRARQ